MPVLKFKHISATPLAPMVVVVSAPAKTSPSGPDERTPAQARADGLLETHTLYYPSSTGYGYKIWKADLVQEAQGGLYQVKIYWGHEADVKRSVVYQFIYERVARTTLEKRMRLKLREGYSTTRG
jgi:hypothetical protein